MVFITDLQSCQTFISGDKAVLREILHPDKAHLKLRYSLAHATVKAGATTLPHRLKTSEVYYILAGKGIMHVNDEYAATEAGHTIYIPPGSKQYIQNTEDTDLIFLCIADPAWQAEDEEIL
ncbi:MAG: cupin domain-containing protein [Dehalococcoidales bacterium]|jgi:mannose-6-phosphate isomerase-like protein (cupin superfamily)